MNLSGNAFEQPQSRYLVQPELGLAGWNSKGDSFTTHLHPGAMDLAAILPLAQTPGQMVACCRSAVLFMATMP
jgi:hypothetical protein